MVSGDIDRARVAAVCAAVGPQRLRELMQILGARIETLAAAAEIFPEGAEDCLAALHQCRGSAASLGLVALAEGLARMEAHGKNGKDVREAGRALPKLWKKAKQELLF
jgi:HPt (histidine-containing phosphotransfer) domain-containing protein